MRRQAGGTVRAGARPGPRGGGGRGRGGGDVAAQEPDDVGRGDPVAGPAREEAPGDEPARAEVTAAREHLLEVHDALVPPEHARRDLEAVPELQGAAVLHGRRRDDGVPALVLEQGEPAEVGDEVAARDVHHLQVHAVVHVQVEVEVARAHAHAGDGRLEDAAARHGLARHRAGDEELDLAGHRGRLLPRTSGIGYPAPTAGDAPPGRCARMRAVTTTSPAPRPLGVIHIWRCRGSRRWCSRWSGVHD